MGASFLCRDQQEGKKRPGERKGWSEINSRRKVHLMLSVSLGSRDIRGERGRKKPTFDAKVGEERI